MLHLSIVHFLDLLSHTHTYTQEVISHLFNRDAFLTNIRSLTVTFAETLMNIRMKYKIKRQIQHL